MICQLKVKVNDFSVLSYGTSGQQNNRVYVGYGTVRNSCAKSSAQCRVRAGVHQFWRSIALIEALLDAIFITASKKGPLTSVTSSLADIADSIKNAKSRITIWVVGRQPSFWTGIRLFLIRFFKHFTVNKNRFFVFVGKFLSLFIDRVSAVYSPCQRHGCTALAKGGFKLLSGGFSLWEDWVCLVLG